MKKIVLTTTFEAPVDVVWSKLLRSETLRYVTWPLLIFRPIDEPFPEEWTDGEHEASLWFFGFFPLGRQIIDISREVDPRGVRRLRDAGRGQIARTWDHVIVVEPGENGEVTRYTDEVTVEAGLLTWPVAAFARVFYGHRQRRWKRLLMESRG